MDKINLWGSDDNDYESEVSEDATTEATVLTTKAPSHTTEQDSSGDDAGLAFNALFMLLFAIIGLSLDKAGFFGRVFGRNLEFCSLILSFFLFSLNGPLINYLFLLS